MEHSIGDLVYSFNDSFGYITEIDSMMTGNGEVPIYVVEWFNYIAGYEIGRYESGTITKWKENLNYKVYCDGAFSNATQRR